MEIVAACLAGILTAVAFWFLVRWVERRAPPIWKPCIANAPRKIGCGAYGARPKQSAEVSAVDLGRCCVSIGDAFSLARARARSGCGHRPC